MPLSGEMRKGGLEMQKLDLPTGPDLPESPNTVGIETQILDILEVNDKEFRDGRAGFVQSVSKCNGVCHPLLLPAFYTRTGPGDHGGFTLHFVDVHSGVPPVCHAISAQFLLAQA